MVFLDLENVFGSVPYSLLWEILEYFKVPDIVKGLTREYFLGHPAIFHSCRVYYSLEIVGVGHYGRGSSFTH